MEGTDISGNVRDVCTGDIACVIGKCAYVCRNGWHGIHRDITRIVGERAHVSRHGRDSRLVGQVVVVATEQSRLVGQVIVVAAETFGQGHAISFGDGECLTVEGECLRDAYTCRTLRTLRTIADYKGVRTVCICDGHHRAVTGSNRLNCWREAILSDRTFRASWAFRALRTDGTLRAGGTFGTLRPVHAIAEDINLGIATRRGQHQHITGVGGCHRKGRHVARLGSIECVWNTQKLLYARYRIVDTAVGVDFRFQKIGAVAPVDIPDSTLNRSAVTDFEGE